MAKNDGKTIAIISYITIIGWIIALIMNMNEKTELGSFHIRQTLLLYISSAIFVSFFGFIGRVVSLAIFVLWVIGLVGAIQGKQTKVPLLGQWAQDWFKSL